MIQSLRPVSIAMTTLAFGILAAQASTAAAQANTRATSIEEIIVTAQKREQSLHSTTISLTALTSEMIEDAALPDLSSIEQRTPNLNFVIGSDGGNSGVQAFIRGVGQFDFIVTTDPGVGVYVDGIYLARTVGANLEFADIHQVQVLRGPQGTLYGKNTIGGAINVVTKTPTGEQAGSLTTTIGDYNYVGVAGYLEMPLVKDVLAGSVSILSKQSDGWQKRSGDDAGNDDMFGVRTHLNWTPSENFGSHLVFDLVNQDQNVYPHVLETFNQNAFFPFLYNAFVSPGNPCCTAQSDIDRSGALNQKDQDKLDSWGLSWTNSWELGDVTLKSVTGYRDMQSDVYRDSDNAAVDYFSVGIGIDQDQFSQEFILNGKSMNERLDWVAGVYYLDEDTSQISDVVVADGLYEALSQLPLSVTLPNGVPIAFLAVPLDLTLLFDQSQQNTSYAAYVHGIYSISDQLRLTLAARYTTDEKELSTFTLKQASQTPIALPGVSGSSACTNVVASGNGSYYECKEDWDEFTPKVGLDWDINEAIMTYISVSRGFRSGVFNGRPLSAAEVSVADPEILTSYEWGFKTEWFDRRLEINGAFFYNDYQDQQFLVNRSSAALAGGLALIVENAADSTMRGMELEFTAVPTEGLTLYGGIGYVDAQFENFESINPATGLPEDLSDREFQNTPEWTVNFGAQYEFIVAGGSSLRLLASGYYRDDVFLTNDKAALDYDVLHADNYTSYDAGIIFSTPDDHWEIALRGKNLSDDRTLNGGFTVDAFGATDVTYTAPRRYFLSLKYQL